MLTRKLCMRRMDTDVHPECRTKIFSYVNSLLDLVNLLDKASMKTWNEAKSAPRFSSMIGKYRVMNGIKRESSHVIVNTT